MLHGFLKRSAPVGSAHAVLDSDEALISLAVNLGAAVAFQHLTKLRQRNSLAGAPGDECFR